MSVAPVRLHDHVPDRSPPAEREPGGGTEHGHAHSHGHVHHHEHHGGPREPVAHDLSAHHVHGHHSHAAGERHPAARPGFSLLRLSAWQRLAIAVPLAGLLWAAALAVIGVGV